MPLTRMKVQALVLVVMKLSEDKKAKKRKRNHCVKSDRIWKFSGPYFPAFGLNTEGYFISPRIQSERGKIQTRKTPNTDTFYAVKMDCQKMDDQVE